jgi:glycosyltransferase involved in cell wall biosynthesis
MRILQVTPYFPPSWEAGGVARTSYEISRALSRKGHEVTVYTTNRCMYDTGVTPNKPQNLEGIRVFYFENLRRYIPGQRTPPLPYCLPLVARRQIDCFDLIHLHDFRTTLSIMIYHYAKKYEVPYVLQCHGSVLPFHRNRTMKKTYDLFFGNRILKDASRIVAITNTERDDYARMGVPDVRVISVPTAIDLSLYSNLPKRGTWRSKLNISEDEKIILYVGRVHESKGLDLLLKAFADVARISEGVRLALVGPDDGFMVSLRKLAHSLGIENKIIATGYVSHREKTEAMVDSDVFVTPTFSGFPMTFLEASACGVPIITTDQGDALDWIHGRVGCVVRYRRDELRGAMIRLIENDRLRKSLGCEGRRIVEERFSLTKIADDIERMYRDVAGS